ncbi:MAG: hypothetical protein K0S65_2175 [Labilithrix sp.]|nr:hypothetical protein [Labilithrix sp.]
MFPSSFQGAVDDGNRPEAASGRPEQETNALKFIAICAATWLLTATLTLVLMDLPFSVLLNATRALP